MSTVSAQHVAAPTDGGRWWSRVLTPELWAGLAITAIWIAVLFAVVFGPDFVSSTTGGSTTRIPSGIVVAIFAYLATRVVARYGFGRGDGDKPSAEDG